MMCLVVKLPFSHSVVSPPLFSHGLMSCFIMPLCPSLLVTEISALLVGSYFDVENKQ